MLNKTLLEKITLFIQWYIDHTVLFCSIYHTLFCTLFILQNTYITCRDNIILLRDLTITSRASFEKSEYQCDGNETIIHECSTEGSVCSSENDVRTRLSCKGESENVYTSI